MGLKKILKYFKDAFMDCDKILLFISVILCVFGLFNIVNVSSQEVANVGESIYKYFIRQLGFEAIGFLIAIFIVSITLNKKTKNVLLTSLFVAAVLGNAYLVLKGSSTRGATNWIKFGQFSIQPSELSKPIIIAFTAFLFEKYRNILKDPKKDHTREFVIISIVGLVIPLLVFLQKDIGTGSIILASYGVMFLFSPTFKKDRLKMIQIYGALGIVGVLILLVFKGGVLTGAQTSRLDFFDPCDTEKFQNSGYQVCNAFIAINRGGLTGVGIGKSTQKYSYIPEPHTDMVFAIISEEYGFIVGAVIIILYAIIIYRILNLATYATSIYGRFTCLGVATYISAHIIINLGGMFGLLPLTGVPLPFLSYGGSFSISLIVALAMVEKVHIDTKRTKIF